MIYNDRVQPTLRKIGGEIRIRRASHVEPNAEGLWEADLGPVGGPKLGPFESRREALVAEQAWIERNAL